MHARGASLVALLAVALAGAGGASADGSVPPPCGAGALSGAFALVPGSEGAGNVSYTLTLRNRSGRTCSVSAIPALRLLDGKGRRLPTKAERTAGKRVVLAPGASAAATAHFTPNVPGPGEPTDRQCEPTAYRLRVGPFPAGRTLTVKVRPPTPVCVSGRMSFSALRLQAG